MSLQIYDKTTGSLTVVAASATRTWIGSKAAHDTEALANTLPNNCLLAVLATGLYYRDASGVESLVTVGGDSDVQAITMPTADVDHLGKVVQYIGTTTVDYTHGYFYECVSDGAGGYEWTDLQVQSGGATIQYTTLPTASISELGRVVQYIGTTTQDNTHGYFYECVFDGTDYKWVNVPVQDNSKNIQVTSLPVASVDELNNIYEYIGSSTATLNNGFFYKCVYDDVTSTYKWENIKVQEDSGSDTQYDTIPTADSTREGDIIQYTGDTTVDYTNGYFYKCINDNGVYKWVNVIVQDSGSNNIVEGYYNSADGKFYEEDTFTTEIVGKSETIYIDLDSNKSYRWNGTSYIVIASENEKIQYETLPTADSIWENVILQYTGATTADYEHGHFYECVLNGLVYEWEELDVCDIGTIQLTTMPTANASLTGIVYQYIGATTQDYVHNYFYECVSDGQSPASYLWVQTDVQPCTNNIVEGYRNDTDGLFYEESTYTTAITGTANTEYIDLTNNKTYRWNGTEFVRLDDETTNVATSGEVGIVKPDNLTTFIDADGTLHAQIWAGTLGKYYSVKDKIPDDTVIIITDYDGVPPNTFPDNYYVNDVKIVPWSQGTDAELADMIAAADAGVIDLSDYWSIGDERTVHLSAMTAGNGLYAGQREQDVTLVLMNEGYPGSEHVNYVWGQKDCLAAYGKLYSSIESSHYSEYSWGGCDLRVDLNDKYYNALPATFRSCLKQFNTMTTAYADSAPIIQTRQDYISIFAEKEIFGNEALISNPNEIEALTQMEYYKNVSNRRKKCAANSGNITTWWTRSPRKNEAFLHFCDVRYKSDNTIYPYYQLQTRYYGIAPFGCI